MRSLALVATFAVLFSIASNAPAQSEADVEGAKRLGTDGLKLYDEGKFEEALVKFDEADKLARVPTLDLYAARCLYKLRRLTEARTRYDEVTRTVLPVGSSPKWLEAKTDASKELKELEGRIPVVSVHVKGAGERPVALAIDGKEVPITEGEHLVDPGKHALDLVVDARHFPRQVDIKEGGRATVEFDVAPKAPVGPVRPAEKKGPSPLLVAGATTVALGGAGLVVWGATGGAALAKASSRHCDGAQCQGDVGGLRTLRTVSTVGFYVGVPLTVLGATLLTVSAVTSSGKKTTARIGPSGAELTLSF